MILPMEAMVATEVTSLDKDCYRFFIRLVATLQTCWVSAHLCVSVCVILQFDIISEFRQV